MIILALLHKRHWQFTTNLGMCRTYLIFDASNSNLSLLLLSFTGAIPFSSVAVQNRALSPIEDRTMSFGQSPKSPSFKNDRRGKKSVKT
jgi:hypothetical protein